MNSVPWGKKKKKGPGRSEMPVGSWCVQGELSLQDEASGEDISKVELRKIGKRYKN